MLSKILTCSLYRQWISSPHLHWCFRIVPMLQHSVQRSVLEVIKEGQNRQWLYKHIRKMFCPRRTLSNRWIVSIPKTTCTLGRFLLTGTIAGGKVWSHFGYKCPGTAHSRQWAPTTKIKIFTTKYIPKNQQQITKNIQHNIHQKKNHQNISSKY
jgi:hypothetical protein